VGIHHSIQQGQAIDAMGDIVIYHVWCSTTLGLNLSDCIDYAWSEVMTRDWSKNKETGVIEDERSTGAAGL
jgi:hypothetical protein